MSKTTAYQRGIIIAEWLTDVRGGFTIEEHVAIAYPLRPNLGRTYDSWLQGAERNAGVRVKNGIWERLPDGRYRTIN